MYVGLYYPPGSLKTRLCLRGRHMLYERCQKYDIPYRKTGKLVVAHYHQRSYVENLYMTSKKLKWPEHSAAWDPDEPVLPTELISGDDARELEPDLHMGIIAALWCPATGIIDSHALMESLEKDIIESENGELAYSTTVVRVDPYKRSTRPAGSPDIDAAEDGWVVQTVTGDATEGDAVLARTLINASGLSANLVLNSLLPEDARIPMYFARGSYASYNGPGISSISRLIYPSPSKGKPSHDFQSLGTHLTVDLQGKVRFGPDLEWISPPPEKISEELDAGYWEKHLVPDESRLEEMHQSIQEYLPDVTLERLQPDYVGIRPKLLPPHGGFQDFILRTDYSSDFGGGGDRDSPMITLMGIESPGLTSSLAIAEMVVEDMLIAKR